MYEKDLTVEWLGKSYLPSEVQQDFTFHTRKVELEEAG
jgi:hypothetical protein